MHSAYDIRTVKCLDGLHFSFRILGWNYSGLYETCVKISSDQSNLAPALSRCWSIIDLVHRIREIAQAVPGLSHKNEHLSTFLDKTSVAETFRHYIQHLRSELSKKEVNPFPVWGALSWEDPNDSKNSFMVLSGANIHPTRFTGSIYDLKKQKWVSKVTLGIDKYTFNFDPVVENTLEFADFIIPWMLGNYRPGVKIETKYPIYQIGFKSNA